LFTSAVAVFTGFLLVAFPRMDQPWLDALEDIAPHVQTAFLDPGERFTRSEALESIERAHAELARLRALDQDVRWGKVEMEQDKAERLRQYLAGRSEISAGDQLVLRHMRGKARERQRFGLGLPLLLLGAWGLYVLKRRAVG
jgi:zinc/manganese transport system permease protein